MTQYQPPRRVLDRRTRDAIGANRQREVNVRIAFDASQLLDPIHSYLGCRVVTVAWFRNEELVRLERRDVACRPRHDSHDLDVTDWRNAR